MPGILGRIWSIKPCNFNPDLAVVIDTATAGQFVMNDRTFFWLCELHNFESQKLRIPC